jgi:hypothetical protein
MPTKTYYAKLDCLSTVATAENLSGEYYKSFCDFMSYLTASNVATLVSWNSGSGAVSGSFDTRTYWDGARPFGLGSHTLWRFHTSSTRNWEWYLYAQVVSGNLGVQRYAFNTPISGYNNSFDAPAGNQNNRGILIQSAVCFSGSSSFNPWNGSLSDGSGNASQGAGNGLIRWVSGANNRQLYVLPRSNDINGDTSTRKDNGICFPYIIAASTSPFRYHFIYDGDALFVATDQSNNNTYGFGYIGGFELRNALTASGIGESDFGFLLYAGPEGNAGSIIINTSFGDTAGTNSTTNGGIAVPIGNMTSGSKTAIPQSINNFLGSTYQPNTLTSTYDEFPVYVGSSEAGTAGYLGNMNSGLVRYVNNLQSHDMKDDFSRAIVGGTTTLTDNKMSIPWTGSIAIGVGTSRTGSNYTWTTNYG